MIVPAPDCSRRIVCACVLGFAVLETMPKMNEVRSGVSVGPDGVDVTGSDGALRSPAVLYATTRNEYDTPRAGVPYVHVVTFPTSTLCVNGVAAGPYSTM